MDLSTTIDNYTEFEDTEYDELYGYGACPNCYEPDTGYCRCRDLELESGEKHPSDHPTYQLYKKETLLKGRRRNIRQSKRRIFRSIAAWQRTVFVISVLRYWSRLAVSPQSRAVQRASERFRAMQAYKCLPVAASRS